MPTHRRKSTPVIVQGFLKALSMKEITIKVLRPKFDEISEMIACQNIAEERSVPGLPQINGDRYVIHSGYSDQGYIKLAGHKVVPIAEFKGEFPPMNYSEHCLAMTEGTIKRGYEYQIVIFRKEKFVCTGDDVFFEPVESEIQLNLF